MGKGNKWEKNTKCIKMQSQNKYLINAYTLKKKRTYIKRKTHGHINK